MKQTTGDIGKEFEDFTEDDEENEQVLYLSDKIIQQLKDLGFNDSQIKTHRLGYSTYQNEVKACGFTIFDNVVLRYPYISPTAKTLYAIFLSFAWRTKGMRKRYVFPTMKTLSTFLGRSEAQVIEYTKELEAAKLIVVIRGGRKSNPNRQAVNVYSIPDIPQEIIGWYTKTVLGKKDDT